MERSQIDKFITNADIDITGFDPVVKIELAHETLVGYILDWSKPLNEDKIEFMQDEPHMNILIHKDLIKHIKWLNEPPKIKG